MKGDSEDPLPDIPTHPQRADGESVRTQDEEKDPQAVLRTSKAWVWPWASEPSNRECGRRGQRVAESQGKAGKRQELAAASVKEPVERIAATHLRAAAALWPPLAQ